MNPPPDTRDTPLWPQGELAGVPEASIILSGVVNKDFTALVPEYPATLALDCFVMDAPLYNPFQQPFTFVAFFIFGVFPNLFVLVKTTKLLYGRFKARAKGQTKNKANKCGMRDYVYLSCSVFTSFNLVWTLSMLYSNTVSEYPVGFPGTGDVLGIMTPTCHFFGRAISNVQVLRQVDRFSKYHTRHTLFTPLSRRGYTYCTQDLSAGRHGLD